MRRQLAVAVLTWMLEAVAQLVDGQAFMGQGNKHGFLRWGKLGEAGGAQMQRLKQWVRAWCTPSSSSDVHARSSLNLIACKAAGAWPTGSGSGLSVLMSFPILVPPEHDTRVGRECLNEREDCPAPCALCRVLQAWGKKARRYEGQIVIIRIGLEEFQTLILAEPFNTRS
ncbi:hypothetical protein D2917_31440 (plasmid) [Cupriavidus oxalaticus]|uniref:Uncharacterized protein n=1 Tax=Cupriavidus oxalaticus TaxID=96344 RepID=A0A5P3VTM2_9BURK|nr:hypothetical protein D2917_31440 [Cupriavidus oxalaticus]